jgi:hypothetical protein
MNLSRFSIAFKALRQLGFTPVALNALYKFGLKTGYFRWRTDHRPQTTDHRPSSIVCRPLFDLPSPESLLAALGPGGLQALHAEADEIVSGKFRQFGGQPVEIDLTPPGPLAHWTEYETGKTAIPNSRFPIPDIKFTWEPARFGWAFVLGRAYHVTNDEKYAAAFWRYFEIFQSANPPYLGPNWTSGQEVGLRLMAFVWAGQVFAKSEHSSPARLANLAVSTAAHATRIPATLLYARSQNNNHLLTEAAALYTAALALPDHPHATHWLKIGQKWLAWCFKNQIDAYGEYVQHSANYQRLMLQIALWLDVIARSRVAATRQSHVDEEIATLPAAQVARNDMVRENLALATHWLLSLLDSESGRVPNLGANDGALIFPFSTGEFADFRPITQAAARGFLGYTLPSGAWDEMSLWFGLPQTESLLGIPRYPGENIYAPHSWGYLRAIRFKSRPSHADQLHFDLWWRGLNITLDPGTYLYNAAPPWDNRLTSTLVHNTVSVDGLEQMTRVSRFLYLDWANATSKQHFETDSDYFQRNSARTYAYAKVYVRHDRTVTVFNDERWLVEDELLNVTYPGKAPLAHVYRLHWLLPDWEWKLENRDSGIGIRLKSPFGWIMLEIKSEPANLQPVTTLVRAGELISQTSDVLKTSEVSPTRGWVSPTYAHKIPALSLSVEVQSAESVKFSSEFTFPTMDDRP